MPLTNTSHCLICQVKSSPYKGTPASVQLTDQTGAEPREYRRIVGFICPMCMKKLKLTTN